jgi:hypothetical protein
MKEPRVTVEENNDPVHYAELSALHERTKLNRDWLAAHWPDLLPGVRGRFIVVAGQEAFVGDTSDEAWKLARAAHPDDDGAIIQYVRKDNYPRIYANRGDMGSV